MTRAPASPVTWIASAALLVCGALVAWVGLRPPPASRCGWPLRAAEMKGFAGADDLRERSGGRRDGTLVWLEGRWKVEHPDDPRMVAQFIVSTDVSDLAVDPLWMTPVLEFPTDETEAISLSGQRGPVPAELRISTEPIVPFVEGWIHAFDDRAIDAPLRFLVGRAFRAPLTPAPPITMMSASHERGRATTGERKRIVRERLEAMWRQWESSCRS